MPPDPRRSRNCFGSGQVGPSDVCVDRHPSAHVSVAPDFAPVRNNKAIFRRPITTDSIGQLNEPASTRPFSGGGDKRPGVQAMRGLEIRDRTRAWSRHASKNQTASNGG